MDIQHKSLDSFSGTKGIFNVDLYLKAPSGVPTATKAALGTGDTPLVYQTPPKPHSVQETPLRCTKRHFNF